MKNSLYLRSGLLALVLLVAIPAALGATSITGPTVISSPGTYVLAEDISGGSPGIWIQSSGVTIEGNGHTISGAGGSYGILVNKDGTTLSDVTISDVRLEDWNCGLYFKGVADCEASGVKADSNGKAGINLRSASGTTVTDCTATGNEQGILLWQDCDNNTIANNTATENDDAGIYVASTGRADGGIIFDSTGNTISGNTVTGNGQGIYLDFTRDNEVTGNTVAENDDYGIFLDYSSGNRLEGNTVNGHEQSGFVLFDSGGCSISGNTASGNGDCGLWAIESPSLSIGENAFGGNGDGALKLSGGSSRA
jgi:parallel beta-helix repeat protein